MCVCAYMNVYITFCFLFVNGHSGYFHLLAIVNNAAVNLCEFSNSFKSNTLTEGF